MESYVQQSFWYLCILDCTKYCILATYHSKIYTGQLRVIISFLLTVAWQDHHYISLQYWCDFKTFIPPGKFLKKNLKVFKYSCTS